MTTPDVSIAMMEGLVARFRDLRGSNEAFLDQRIPGYRRRIINLIGMGVTEKQGDPALRPNIPTPAHGFATAIAQCDPGEGAALHAHPTEEIFMPLVSRFAIVWLTSEGSKEITLDPFDTVSVPTGIYRGFRNVGNERGSLFAVIGGPDTGKVSWHPSVIEEARATGLTVDDRGVLQGAPPPA